MSKSTEPFPLISRQKSVYRDGTSLQVKILDARVRKLKTANKWLVDELCEPIQGGKSFWQQRGGLVSPIKPIKFYTEKYNNQADAEDVALKVRALARAYEYGQILIQNEADLSVGGRSVVIEQTCPDGEVKHFAARSLSDAIAEAERKIWSAASSEQPVSAAKVRVYTIDGLVQAPPFGRWLDFDAVRSWMDTHIREGLYLVIEETQGHCAYYNPVLVERIDRPTKGRVYCTMPPSYAQSGTFYKNGKHCWAPTGQSRLLPPFDPIWRAAVNRHCFSIFDWGRIEPKGKPERLNLDLKHAELIEGLKMQGSSGLGPFVELEQTLQQSKMH